MLFNVHSHKRMAMQSRVMCLYCEPGPTANSVWFGSAGILSCDVTNHNQWAVPCKPSLNKLFYKLRKTNIVNIHASVLLTLLILTAPILPLVRGL